MKFYLLPLILCLTNTLIISAQESLVKTYDWDNTVEYSFTSEKDRDILYVAEYFEFAYENSNLVEYRLFHQAHLLKSDEIVNSHNKLFIPTNESTELIKVKIRVISPDGSVAEESEPKLLSSTDENTGEYYTYYAIEGIKIGDVVEYIYLIKKVPQYSGIMRMIQKEYPLRSYHFRLIAPLNLVFAFKTYNTDSIVHIDSNYSEQNVWKLDLYNLPGIEEEVFAPVNLLSAKLIYKLDWNKYNNARDISSYGNVSQNIYNNLNEIDKKESKAISKFIKKLDISAGAETEEKIRLLEQSIKNDIRIDNVGGADNVVEILDGKAASEFGLMRIFVNALDELGVDYEIVVTSDRDRSRFDEEFESLNFLSEYLFFFPKTQAFLAPTYFNYRYGLVPAEFTDNNGLFIKERALGDFITGVGKIKFIPPAPYAATRNDHNINVVFKEDMSDVELEIENQLSGYYAVGLQPYLAFLDQADKDDLLQNYFKATLESIDLIEWNADNTDAVSVGRKPLILRCKANDNSLIKMAGNQFLFKVGLLIGPQMEMYSEKERKNPLYADYKREYSRAIKVNIPSGYRISNLDDIKLLERFEKDGKEVMRFESDYKQSGNILIISITEYYDQLYFPLNEYEAYRRVINSAADFNKVTLVLEKE